MLRTEEEARKCWCPFARVREPLKHGYGLSANRFMEGGEAADHTRCIASECMAWRWGVESDGDDGFTAAYRRTPVKDSPGHFDNAPLGYCGLAGKP